MTDYVNIKHSQFWLRTTKFVHQSSKKIQNDVFKKFTLVNIICNKNYNKIIKKINIKFNKYFIINL